MKQSRRVKSPEAPAPLTLPERMEVTGYARLAFPVALGEFYRAGGKGETWDDYDDLAESVFQAAEAMVRMSRKRSATFRAPGREAGR